MLKLKLVDKLHAKLKSHKREETSGSVLKSEQFDLHELILFTAISLPQHDPVREKRQQLARSESRRREQI